LFHGGVGGAVTRSMVVVVVLAVTLGEMMRLVSSG
jgi:hypothetical protein